MAERVRIREIENEEGKYAGGRPPQFSPDQRAEIKNRVGSPRRVRVAVLDLEPVQAGRLSGGTGGGRRHLSRGLADAAT